MILARRIERMLARERLIHQRDNLRPVEIFGAREPVIADDVSAAAENFLGMLHLACCLILLRGL